MADIPVINKQEFGEQRVPYIGLSVEQAFLLMYPTLLIPVICLWLYNVRQSRRARLQPDGCVRLGKYTESNITDEYDDHKYATGIEPGTEASGEPRWKVKALFIYPIKSCAPVELDEADVEGSGMKWDRQFAFAEFRSPLTQPNEPRRWIFRSQRADGFEKLALVKAEVWIPDPAATKKARSGPAKDGALIVKYPYVPEGFMGPIDRWMISMGYMSPEVTFSVPLTLPDDHQYPLQRVDIWKNSPEWYNLGSHLPAHFQTWIGGSNPVSLFRANPETQREVFRNAPRKEELGYQPTISFQDAYPLHILNIASVRDVAAKVGDEIPNLSIRRFRPNVLLSGPGPYDEDDWKRIRIGSHAMYCTCHTVRCLLPNNDPDTGVKHSNEPNRTLKRFRCIDDGDPNNACLGLQCVPAKEAGIHVRVGDGVEVLARGEHHYIKQ